MVKLMARNVLDGIFDDLMENKVLTRGELQRLGEEVDHIVNRTGDLVDDLTEKTQMAGKIFKDRFFNPKKQLSLSEYLSKGLVTCSLSTILMEFLSSFFFLQVDNILFIFLAPSLPILFNATKCPDLPSPCSIIPSLTQIRCSVNIC